MRRAALRRSTLLPPLLRVHARKRGYATTPARHADYDVVIAGGGAMGASAAYHLALADPTLSIAIVERDVPMAHASAPRSAGGIRQQFSLLANIELSLYGVEFLRRASTDLRLPGEEPPDLQFKEQGYLFLASAQGEPTLRRNHATQCGAGAHTALYTPSELASRFPWLNLDNIALGCFGEEAEGWFDPHALVVALRAKAKQMGVTLINGSVAGVECARASPALKAGASSSDAKLEVTAVKVRSSAGGGGGGGGGGVEEQQQPQEPLMTIGAGHLINCAGAFANDIVGMCRSGDEDGGEKEDGLVAQIPVRARRRSIFSVHVDAPDAPPSTTTPLTVDPSGVYFRPEGPAGRYLCGVSPPAEHPDPDCVTVDELETVDHSLFDEVIWPSLYHRCEAFGSLKVQSAWSGFYEYNTVDQNALIGRHPHVPNLILCNGFSGHGLQQSPGAGRAVAELIASGGYQTVDVSCFGFERLLLRDEPLFEQNIV